LGAGHGLEGITRGGAGPALGDGRAALLRGEGTRVAGAAAGTWLGALFESLVAQSALVYAAAAGARVGHLRTKNGGHEVDLVVEGEDRACVAIEVKLGGDVGGRDVSHLNWLRRQVGERLVERVVVYVGRFAYRRADGVAVVPRALLGA
jgi:hypothetical protein